MERLHDEETPTELEYMDVSFTMPFGPIVGRWYGNRKVRPLLAVHGWLDNMGSWEKLLPLLPRHLGVLCVDLPGHGYSTQLPNGITYHGMDYSLAIKRIMDEYEWKKVSLLTHSMGSVVCWIFASVFPHRVDMLVSIDIVQPITFRPESIIRLLNHNFEKLLIEDDRIAMAGIREPPSYTLDQLEHVTHKGSSQSVDVANSKHIYGRNIKKSELYPGKYYFSRDARLKYYFPPLIPQEMIVEMTKSLYKLPFCVVKGTMSNYINERSNDVVELLRRHNPHFELHEVQGTHHVHLNNAAEVAEIINPFICRYRPPMLESWSVGDDSDAPVGKKPNRRYLKWKWKRSKL